LKVPLKSAESSLRPTGSVRRARRQFAVAEMTIRSIEFGSFTLDLDRLCLRGPSGQVGLRPKSFEVLRFLAEHAGRVITKDEVIKAVWRGVVVTDESLAVCISEVRRALGDKGQQVVKTVPRRGYLFDLPITVSDVAPASPSGRRPRRGHSRTAGTT
jgi:DNA-binding winged helix-turn-helix (wHTH) protein